MYTRRYYRKTPPNYGGVTFSMPRESSFVSETEGNILQGQQDERTSFSSWWQEGGKEHAPAALSPLIGEGGVWLCREDAVQNGEKREPRDGAREASGEKAAISSLSEKDDGKGELILLGVLLFLLGSGVDGESLYLLFSLLILLT